MPSKAARTASVTRKTKETDIEISLGLDSGTNVAISTGVGFFDHMLDLFAHHGKFALSVSAKGDTYIDDHHTVEDVGLALGEAFYTAAGDKVGIARYASVLLPMDEALVEVALDYSGRPYLHFGVEFHCDKCGSFDTALVEEFFRAFAMSAKLTLHINLRYGRNDHHIAEAIFKAVARVLKGALTVVSQDLPSTKGFIA